MNITNKIRTMVPLEVVQVDATEIPEVVEDNKEKDGEDLNLPVGRGNRPILGTGQSQIPDPKRKKRKRKKRKKRKES